MDTAHSKLEKLKHSLRAMGSVAVAFSGGVDSTFLMAAAHEVLGERAVAITGTSYLFPAREMDEARAFATSRGMRHIECEIDVDVPGFVENSEKRCYICKKNLFEHFIRIAAAQGITCVAEGSNVDDDGDYRPGMQAVKELGVLSPLRGAGLTKAEIRILSGEMQLPTWNKPSFACLASRLPYGEVITRDRLMAVETSERALLDMGFRQVRVRYHGDVARIEVGCGEMERMLSAGVRDAVHAAVRRAGFSYVALDLRGYRTGSMNETVARV